MKLCTNQSIPCEFLKGACIFLSDEDEGRYIKDVCVDLEKHSIILGKFLDGLLKTFFVVVFMGSSLNLKPRLLFIKWKLKLKTMNRHIYMP